MIYNIAMSLIDIECSYLLSREWKLFHFKTTEKCDETVRGEKYFSELNVYQRCANILLTKGVLHLHSSFVLHQGKALLFTGPSGIGKTTQAELWRDYQGSMIVNGDACLMRKIEGGWYAFGTPVHGTSSYCENKKAPISAIIILKQWEENLLVKADPFSALSSSLSEFYRPRMRKETEEKFWNAIDSLFQEIPFYHLNCRPDKEATEIVKREIFSV